MVKTPKLALKSLCLVHPSIRSVFWSPPSRTRFFIQKDPNLVPLPLNWVRTLWMVPYSFYYHDFRGSAKAVTKFPSQKNRHNENTGNDEPMYRDTFLLFPWIWMLPKRFFTDSTQNFVMFSPFDYQNRFTRSEYFEDVRPINVATHFLSVICRNVRISEL